MVLGAFYPDISGGAVQCFNLIEALNDSFDFYIIATCKISSNKRRTKRIFSEETIGRIKIFRINLYPGNIVSEILSFFAIPYIFFKISRRVDIFHMHGYTRKSCLITILAKIFQKKIIVKTTSLGIDDPLSIKKRRFVSPQIYYLIDAYVVTSPAQKESCRISGLPENKIFMIPNGVNLNRFNIPSAQERLNLRQEMGIPYLSDVILLVGFFSQDKGFDIFAESLLLLRPDELSNLFLIFIGSKDDGELEVDVKVVKKVYNIISSLEMESRCLFVDPTHEIDKYFKASDIFVLPSKREGLPNALLEAMACGLYCIANKLEGTTDYIIDSGKDGHLLNALTPDSIAGALKNVIGNKQLQSRIGAEARLKINSMFNMDNVKDKYKGLYSYIS